MVKEGQRTVSLKFKYFILERIHCFSVTQGFTSLGEITPEGTCGSEKSSTHPMLEQAVHTLHRSEGFSRSLDHAKASPTTHSRWGVTLSLT